MKIQFSIMFYVGLIFILSFLFLSQNYLPANATQGEDSPVSNKTVTLTNPIGSTDIPTLIGYIIKAVMGIVGSLALVMVIYGGFVWMTAAGNAEKVTQGKNILIWAIIGLVVIFSAYIIVANIISVTTTGELIDTQTSS